MRNFTITILLFALSFAFPQERKVYFDDALSQRLSVYNKRIDESIAQKDRERTSFLFDSLFTNHLKDTYVRPLELQKIGGGKFNTEELDIPFVLITKSAWFVQDEDEITIINDFAKRYEDQIKLVVLFWGDHKTSKKVSRNYNREVITAYIDEVENEYSHTTAIYKHAFGAPACYFISEKKQLAFIDKTFTLISANAQINSLEDTSKQLALLLFKDESTDEGIFTTIEEPNKKDTDTSVEN